MFVRNYKISNALMVKTLLR